jgi:predicted CXXCH cytochrome family protein
MKELRCTGCHDPHGSTEKLLFNSTTVHPPFAEAACEFCHEGSSKKLIQEGTKDLCYTCHTDIQELVTTSKVKHPAFDVAECTDCHTPHASLQQRLVKFPGGKVCTDCHVDKAAEEGETQHGVINLLGCRACHEPHGGPRKNMLRMFPPDLCIQCHVAGNRKTLPDGQVQLLGRFRVSAKQAARIPSLPLRDGRNHPVSNHRVIGAPTAEELERVTVDFKGELSCLVCHNPHKGRHKLLVNEAKSTTEMCMRCHKK